MLGEYLMDLLLLRCIQDLLAARSVSLAALRPLLDERE